MTMTAWPGLWSPQANGTLMARGGYKALETIRAQAGDTASDLGLHVRAGDGNRTRTISLGSLICDPRPTCGHASLRHLGSSDRE
jgi:hypothetical protein